MMARVASGRNDGIDLLRGLSILLVLTHHISIRIPLRLTFAGTVVPAPLVTLFARDGQDAVSMFFVISGFLISRRSMDRFGSMERVMPGAFYLHRAARILPTLFLLLVVSAFVDLIGVPGFTFVHPNQSLLGATLAVLTCTFNWYEGRTNQWAPANWDVLWSLSIEEAFYIGFPLLCLLWARPRLILLAGLVLLAPLEHGALAHAPEIWREKAYIPGFGAIATGVLAAMTSRSITIGRRGAISLLVIGCAAVCLELMGGAALWRTTGAWSILFLTLGTALMLIAFGAMETLGLHTAPTVGLGWLRRMGPLSYEIYLSHMFLVLPATMMFTASGMNIRTFGLVLYPVLIMACVGFGRGVAALWSRPAARYVDSLTARVLSTATGHRAESRAV